MQMSNTTATPSSDYEKGSVFLSPLALLSLKQGMM
jgi:hypothetical protein